MPPMLDNVRTALSTTSGSASFSNSASAGIAARPARPSRVAAVCRSCPFPRASTARTPAARCSAPSGTRMAQRTSSSRARLRWSPAFSLDLIASRTAGNAATPQLTSVDMAAVRRAGSVPRSDSRAPATEAALAGSIFCSRFAAGNRPVLAHHCLKPAAASASSAGACQGSTTAASGAIVCSSSLAAIRTPR